MVSLWEKIEDDFIKKLGNLQEIEQFSRIYILDRKDWKIKYYSIGKNVKSIESQTI